MPRKKPHHDIVFEPRRWSSRAKISTPTSTSTSSPANQTKSLSKSKSPTKTQTRLPPPRSSPLSGTQSTDSLYEGLGYQGWVAPVDQAQSATEVGDANANAMPHNLDANSDSISKVNEEGVHITTSISTPILTKTLTNVELEGNGKGLGETSEINHPPSPPPSKSSKPLRRANSSKSSRPSPSPASSPLTEPDFNPSSRISSPAPDDYKRRRELSLTPPRYTYTPMSDLEDEDHTPKPRTNKSRSKAKFKSEDKSNVRRKGKRSLPLDSGSDSESESGPSSQRRRKMTASPSPDGSPIIVNRFKLDFDRLFANLDKEDEEAKASSPSPSPVKEKVRPTKEPRQPTKLPAEVRIGSTCLYLFRSSWFLAKLVGFEPGPTLARDRYVVQARDISNERKAKRAEILFLHEPKVKTLKRLGGLSKGVLDLEYYKSDALSRAATPPPDPTNDTDDIPFSDWTRQAQLYHIRPHLLRVIRDEYPPARSRMNAFYLDQKITYLTGDWDQEELSNYFAPELGRWLLRPQADRIPNQAPRPVGSEMFEQLNEADKSKCLINVLIPESLIQLDILINGQTPALLSLTEQEQYTAARKRMLKRKNQKDPWEIPEFEALQAMGRYAREIDEEEKQRQLIAQGTHVINFAGSERMVKKVNYAAQL